jgi:uncharacterized membrane protein YfcA
VYAGNIKKSVDFYFPIAEVSLNVPYVIALGMMAGFFAGLFGVGGGFILTPLLIFSGVPPAVAVATQASQLVASSSFGALNHWQQKIVDTRMAMVLSAGGIIGGWGGLRLFALLMGKGHIDLVISIFYVIFLGGIGVFMLWDMLRVRRLLRSGQIPAVRRHLWLHGLPLRVWFPASRLYISVLPILFIGAGVGILVSFMGIGGGFLMIPALLYIVRVPVRLVAGTSLFQILVVSILATLVQAARHHTVDILLALTLVIGSISGAHLGGKIARRWKGEAIRMVFCSILVALAGLMLARLVLIPGAPFVWEVTR